MLCYGLSLPLSENDAIRDCVNVYCEWMSALTTPKTCVPRPVVEDPNPYMQLMMNHLYNVFVPREGAGSTLNPTHTKAGNRHLFYASINTSLHGIPLLLLMMMMLLHAQQLNSAFD